MKKIIAILVLLVSVVGCELFDSEFMDGVEQRRKENGRTCDRNEYGNFYCVDKYGNRIP